MKFKHRYIRQWHKPGHDSAIVDTATEAVELAVNDAYNGLRSKLDRIERKLDRLLRLNANS